MPVYTQQPNMVFETLQEDFTDDGAASPGFTPSYIRLTEPAAAKFSAQGFIIVADDIAKVPGDTTWAVYKYEAKANQSGSGGDDSLTTLSRATSENRNFSSSHTFTSGEADVVVADSVDQLNTILATIEQIHYDESGDKLDVFKDEDHHGNSINNQLLQNFTAPTEKTISGGAITVDQTLHTVDTEADANLDDLDTINGGSAGDLLYLIPASASRSINLRDGIGNISIPGNKNYIINKMIKLVYVNSEWILLGQSEILTQQTAWCYLSALQENLVDSTETKVQIDAAKYDPASLLDPTNYELDIKESGKYLVTIQLAWNDTDMVANKRYSSVLYKNGGPSIYKHQIPGAATYLTISAPYLINLSSGDTLSLYAAQFSGTNTVDVESGSKDTFLFLHKLS